MTKAILLLICVSFATLVAADEFQWQRLPIGGGGRCMDVLPHPNVKGLLYARSDVGGLYRRRPGETAWQSITSWMPVRFRGADGSDGIAIDPHPGRESILYSAFGKCTLETVTSPEANGLWRSDDFGSTWKRIFHAGGIPVGKHNMKEGAFGSNSGKEDRYTNSRVAVDPFNPNVVYVGTRTSGLYLTENALDDDPLFRKLKAMPIGLQDSYHNGLPSGVGLVQPDPHRGTIEGKQGRRARVIYALARSNHPGRAKEPVFNGGIFRSTDGGETFTRLDQGDAPYIVYAIRFGQDGTVYASGDEGVLRLNRDDRWELFGQTTGMQMVAMDVLPGQGLGDDDKLVALGGRTLMRSSDSGKTWDAVQHADCSLSEDFWMNRDGARYWFAKPTGARFDPHDPKRVWTAEPYGPFAFNDVWADKPVVTPAVQGFELTVATSVAPAVDDPEMIAYASVADLGGVAIDSRKGLAKYTFRRAGGVKHVHNSPFLMTLPNRPGTVLWIQSTGGAWGNPIPDGLPKIWISDDRGLHWRSVDGPPADTASMVGKRNNAAGAARIAVSAQNPDHAVFVGANRVPHYTTDLLREDGQVTWHSSIGVPSNLFGSTLIFDGPSVLLHADPGDPQSFT